MKVQLNAQQKQIRVLNTDDVYLGIMQGVLGRQNKIRQNQEYFWVLSLAADHTILNLELVSLGNRSQAPLEPIHIFRLALIKDALRIILIHNHPSGDLTPSPDDKIVTERLIRAGELVGCEVLDHLIISMKKYLSFDTTGLMQKLRESQALNLTLEEVHELKALAKEKGREEGLQEGMAKGWQKGQIEGLEKGVKVGREEIAQAMKSAQEPLAKIMAYTSLTQEQIEKL